MYEQHGLNRNLNKCFYWKCMWGLRERSVSDTLKAALDKSSVSISYQLYDYLQKTHQNRKIPAVTTIFKINES